MKERINFSDHAQVEKIWKQVTLEGFTNSNLLVKESPGKGLGVFAKKEIKKDQIVEFCHAIVLSWKGRYVKDPSITKYAYWSPCACDDCRVHGLTGLILLGNGSVYNSASSDEEKNCSFFIYPKTALAIFVANKNISQGEEILTWWGQGYYDQWCKNEKK